MPLHGEPSRDSDPRPRPFSKVRTHSVTVTVRLRPREDQGREVSPHLLRRHHGYNRNALLPHHLPKLRAGVLQRSLSGDVVPLDPSDTDLKLETGFLKMSVCVCNTCIYICSW